MKINTNRWNRIRYTFYTPVYDSIGRYFRNSRKESIESCGLQAGEKVLIVGAGTGLDLEFIPDDCIVVATDITPSMTRRIRERNKKLKRNLSVAVMDGQVLQFDDDSFDVVILHLILAVIPDPVACIREAERVTRKGGRIAVFDKFVRKNKQVSLLRKILNLFTNFLVSDITRSFEALLAVTRLKLISDKDAELQGNFRRILLQKSA